ncbi:MAG: hypothetical protein GF364_00270 [Candidatus Lokiarchaeota archaeon]|nr:hypothetical protein [Candidatus Lokiarchaeota archaeon]
MCRIRFKIFLIFTLFITYFAITNVINPPNAKYSNHYNQFETPSTPNESLETSIIPDSYKFSRQAAYGYALQWYNDRNDHYNDFSGSGGDCANFVSQCLIAGGLSLHKGTDGGGYGVYPDQDRTISSYGTIPYCDYLDLHLRNYQNTSVTYTTDDFPSVPDEITLGDVVIFGEKNGDKYKHAMIVVTDSGSTVGLAGHSSNKWDEDFFTELSYFSCATFYHINDEQAEYYRFQIDAITLNVRVGPGKNGMDPAQYYQDIGNLHDGEEYIAFEYAFDDNGKVWWHFWFDDRCAWCAASYTENVTAISSNQPIEVDVTTALNVRDGPGTGYSVYGQVYNGMRFVSDDLSGGWYRFWYGGAQKYSSGNFFIELEEYNPYEPPEPVNQTVMGFLPHYLDPNQNFTPLTHVAWFSVEMNSDGSIADLNGWPVTSVIDDVHNAERRIVLTATLFSSTDIHTLISTSSYRTNAISNLLMQVQNGNADGICIDFEHPKTSGDDAYLVDFMSELNSTFKAANENYHVSLCTPSVDWWDTYDYGLLSPHLDAFFIMGYGYYYSGSDNAGPTSPLAGGSFNLVETITDHLELGAEKSKLILGLPFYGYDYPVSSQNKHSSTTGIGDAVGYSENIGLINSYSPDINYDTTYETPWYNYYSSGWHQVWCDSYDSLSVKIDYIIDEKLGGLGIWAWGLQGSQTDIEELIYEKFHFDNIAPTVEIISPVNDTIFRENPITIEWEGTDNIAIDSYAISWDNGEFWDPLGTDTTYIDTLSEDDYVVTIMANDTNGNNSTDSLSFSVNLTTDSIPPELDLISPLNESTQTTNSVYIEWSATDNVAVDCFSISWNDGIDWDNMGLISSFTTDLENGDYELLICANDTSDNNDTIKIVFTVDVPIDTQPPDIDILYPNNNSILDHSELMIEWTGMDDIAIDYYLISWDGIEWEYMGLCMLYECDLDNGNYDFYVMANDTSGNVNQTMCNFSVFVDYEFPEIILITSINNTIITQNDILIDWFATDNVEVNESMISWDEGQTWISVGDYSEISQTLPDGSYHLMIKVNDTSGNESICHVFFTIDTQDPDGNDNRWILWFILGAIAGALIPVTILIVKKKRETRELEEDEYWHIET